MHSDPTLAVLSLLVGRLGEQLLPQRLDLLLDSLLAHAVVLERDLKLETLDFDSTTTLVVENASVWGARAVLVLELGGLVELLPRTNVGPVALDVAVGARASRRAQSDAVVCWEAERDGQPWLTESSLIPCSSLQLIV